MPPQRVHNVHNAPLACSLPEADVFVGTFGDASALLVLEDVVVLLVDGEAAITAVLPAKTTFL
jgi:hypothetical protein